MNIKIILTGNDQMKYEESAQLNIQAIENFCSNNFANLKYAKSATNCNLELLEEVNEGNLEGDLIVAGQFYWLSNVYEPDGIEEWRDWEKNPMVLEKVSNTEGRLTRVGKNQSIGNGYDRAKIDIRPVVDLKSQVRITGGDGSYENPWKIGINEKDASIEIPAEYDISVEFVTNGNNDWKDSNSTVVNVTSADITQIKYYWTKDTKNQTTNVVSSSGTSMSNGQTIQTPSQSGEWYLWIYVKNGANIEKVTRSKVFRIDNVNPTIQSFTATVINYGITINLKATDDMSTIAYYQYSTDNGTTWFPEGGSQKATYLRSEANGEYNVMARVVDVAGHTTTTNMNIPVTVQSVSANLSQAGLNVGDYVNYTCGNWTSTASLPTQLNSFGGYTNGVSKNTSVKVGIGDSEKAQYDGWRVLSVEGNIVKLVHAGSPVSYFVSGETTDSTYIAAMNNFCNTHFVNSTLATSAKSLTYEQVSSVNGGNYREDVSTLLSPGVMIWVTKGEGTQNVGVNIANGYRGEYLFSFYTTASFSTGIRPVVTLKDSVITTGIDSNRVWQISNP